MALLIGACRTAPTPPRFQAQETFLQILSEFKRHQHLDLYRFPAPKDLSGQNVFKSTLVRLANYQELYPNKYTDLIDFISAEAYERLGEYATARQYYLKAADKSEQRISRKLAEIGDDPVARQVFRHQIGQFDSLTSPVAERLGILEEFINLSSSEPSEAGTLEDWIDLLEKQAERWKVLASSIPPKMKDYRSLARIERERADERVARALWQNRLLLKDGSNRAIARQKTLIEAHAASRRHAEHILTLGRWYETLAREYAEEFPPWRAAFSWDFFDRLVALSRGQYRRVEGDYGSRWRREARGHLLLLEAFAQRIRTESR